MNTGAQHPAPFAGIIHVTFDDLAVGDVFYNTYKRASGGTQISYEEIIEISPPLHGKRKLTVKDCLTGRPRTYELGSMIRYHEISGGPKLATAGSIEPDHIGRRIWRAEVKA